MTAEADEPPAPWSAHASAMGAQDPVHSESITMRAHLESVVPANVVPEVERLLKVCCCVVDGVLSCARQSMGMCCAWHGWERCMLCCAVLCCAGQGVEMCTACFARQAVFVVSFTFPGHPGWLCYTVTATCCMLESVQLQLTAAAKGLCER